MIKIELRYSIFYYSLFDDRYVFKLGFVVNYNNKYKFICLNKYGLKDIHYQDKDIDIDFIEKYLKGIKKDLETPNNIDFDDFVKPYVNSFKFNKIESFYLKNEEEVNKFIEYTNSCNKCMQYENFRILITKHRVIFLDENEIIVEFELEYLKEA